MREPSFESEASWIAEGSTTTRSAHPLGPRPARTSSTVVGRGVRRGRVVGIDDGDEIQQREAVR